MKTKDKKEEKNLILEGIEFGIDHLNGEVGVSFADFQEYIKGKFPNTDHNLLQNVFQNIFLNDQERRYGISYNQKYFLTAESYFKYMEWEELLEVRKAAMESRRIAIFAIGISAVLAAASILIQLFKPTEVILNDSQVRKILDNMYETNTNLK